MCLVPMLDLMLDQSSDSLLVSMLEKSMVFPLESMMDNLLGEL